MSARAEIARSGVVRHAGLTFAGLMVANVLGYVFYTLVSRALGVEGYGVFSSLLALVLIVAAPPLIAQTVVAKLASDNAHDPDRLAGLVRSVDRYALVVAVAVAVGFAVLAVPLSNFLHIGDPLLLVLAAWALAGATLLPFHRGILQGTSAFGAFSLSLVVESGAKACFAPMLGLVAGNRGAFAGIAVGYSIAAAYTSFAAARHRRGVPVGFSLRNAGRTSAMVAGAIVCINVLLFFDVVLAKRYLGPYSAGLYGAAALACRAVYAVIAFVPTVLLPETAVRQAAGRRTRVLFMQALGLTAIICGVAIVGYMLQPALVLRIIAGRPFSAGESLLPAYVVAISALAAANVTTMYNVARGRLRFVPVLAIVMLGEIVSIVIRHRSAADFLQTIVVGHTLAFAACMTSLGGGNKPGAPPTGDKGTIQ